jgi:hypothetical protein
MNRTLFYLAAAFICSAMIVIASCGGSSQNRPATSATITGSVFAAPVSGATVVVMNSIGTTTVAGPVTTGSDGMYSVSIPVSALASTLIISSTSGTFIDEATGADTPARELSAYVAGGVLSNGSAAHLDPSTTIIARLVRYHGMTSAQATSAFSGALGFAPDPAVCPGNLPSSSATAVQRLAALRAIVFSQLTKDLGLSPNDQFDLLAAIAEDLADGTLDGKNGSAIVSIGTTTMPEDIANRLEHAIVSLLTNTAVNLTGLTTAEIGSLPFGKIVLTATHKVEYLPGTMPASQGKTSFKIRITKLSDSSPEPGLTVSLMPMMHMPTMKHSTPVDAIVDNGDGSYSCTVYYLMASGMGMGYWELPIKIGDMGGETATFFPSVGMAMGVNTVRTTLKGQSDIISSMTGTENRSYYLFRDGLSGTTTFNLFIAAKESMMNYPAVSLGTVLSAPAGTMTSMTVLASTDNATWLSASDNTKGHWTVSGLTGLTTGTTGTIYIKLNVNGEDKTTDGNVVSGINGYATFTVKP